MNPSEAATTAALEIAELTGRKGLAATIARIIDRHADLNPKQATIYVEGGIVQWADMPAGIVVEVKDYDTDGASLDELTTDDAGRSCVVRRFESEMTNV